MKNLKITDKMQDVALDILSDLEMLLFTRNKTISLDKISDILYVYAVKYNLHKDPFTHMLCTSKEWLKSNDEYERQLSIKKYGYDVRKE